MFITPVSSIFLLISNISFTLLFNHAGSIFSPRENQQHTSGLFPAQHPDDTVNARKGLIPLTSPFNFSLRAYFYSVLLLDLNRALVDAQPLCSHWDVDARYIVEFAAGC